MAIASFCRRLENPSGRPQSSCTSTSRDRASSSPGITSISNEQRLSGCGRRKLVSRRPVVLFNSASELLRGASMWMLIRIAISVVAAHLLAYGFAHAENDACRYLLQRKAGIAHAQKIVSEHVVSASV